ncbi:hypothetical protein CBL_00575 [Carabus blaptoides fortunei]
MVVLVCTCIHGLVSGGGEYVCMRAGPATRLRLATSAGIAWCDALPDIMNGRQAERAVRDFAFLWYSIVRFIITKQNQHSRDSRVNWWDDGGGWYILYNVFCYPTSTTPWLEEEVNETRRVACALMLLHPQVDAPVISLKGGEIDDVARYGGKQRATMIPVSVFYPFFYVPYFLPRQCLRATSSFILPPSSFILPPSSVVETAG